MGNPAFRPYGAQFADAGYGSGDSSGYGLMPYGGGSFTPTVLPLPHYTSDDPRETDHFRVGEIVLERDGIPLSVRKFAERKVWRWFYGIADRDLLEKIKPFFRARRFVFIPDVDDESVEYTVRWVEQEFRPVPYGNGVWRLAFTLEEVP